jgi:hypothetical protein
MNFESTTIAVTLGAVATVPLYLLIRFAWCKYFSPTVEVKRGNVFNAQIGEISGQGAIGIVNSGDRAQFHFNSVLPPQKKYGETEKRKARKEVLNAFNGFFWLYLGGKNLKGQTNDPMNLDVANLRSFKKDRENTIRINLENGRKTFEERLKHHAPILENSEVEGKLDDLRQELVSVKDPFDITEELRDTVLERVNALLQPKQN